MLLCLTVLQIFLRFCSLLLILLFHFLFSACISSIHLSSGLFVVSIVSSHLLLTCFSEFFIYICSLWPNLFFFICSSTDIWWDIITPSFYFCKYEFSSDFECIYNYSLECVCHAKHWAHLNVIPIAYILFLFELHLLYILYSSYF